ncbi:MAG: sulfotransferase [Gammaproteobacteria bacterium]|nr:sulfotransferase [Gammaproteobacteria bacterium]
MSGFHIICGTPRSGSTLLCNVLNQNPKIHASSTSSWLAATAAIVQAVSQNQEILGRVIRERLLGAEFGEEPTRKIVMDIERAPIMCAYEEQFKAEQTVFDKCRGWPLYLHLLERLFPETKLVVCIDDLRQIFASVERANAESAEFSDNSGFGNTLTSRVTAACSPEHTIGGAIVAVEELIRRKSKNALIVKAWEFRNDPELWMRRIYKHCGVEKYDDHDFDNVINVANDIDPMFKDKYRHIGSGKIRPYEPYWSDWLPPDVVSFIRGKFPLYTAHFTYPEESEK